MDTLYRGSALSAQAAQPRAEPSVIVAAREAERHVAEIARTRRPTAEESREAIAAYRAARRYLEGAK